MLAAPRSFSSTFLSRVKIAAIALMLACGLAQFTIDQTINNFACTWIAILTTVPTLLYVLDSVRFRRAPMSCIMILGFNISGLSGALIIQSIGWRPIIYNLESAYSTFLLIAWTQVFAIGVHQIYLRSAVLLALRRAFTRRIAEPLGLMRAPSNLQLYMFGFVGCAATMLSARTYTENVEFGNAAGKLALSFSPFAVAPFLIPMRSTLMGVRSTSSRKSSLILVLYALLLIAVAIANNARATFSAGFLTLGLCVMAVVLTGNLAVTRRRFFVGLLCIGLVAPLFSILSDLATAMVIARDERSNISSLELIEITLSNFQDKPLIEERRHRDAVTAGDEYNENYIFNPILARFVYTKFVDVNMTNALTLTNAQANDVAELTKTRILALLPTPVLNYFQIDINKADNSFSSGDIYNFLSRGLQKGGYTTGSELPDGLTIFGVLFWPILSLMILAQFIVYDGFCVVDRSGQVVIGAIALLNVVPLFTLGVMQESVSNQVISIVRGVPQMILLYSALDFTSAVVTHPKLTARRMLALMLRQPVRS